MKQTICHSLLACVSLAFLISCGDQAPVFHAAENPDRLSAWNLFSVEREALVPNPATLRFQPLNTLFSDYAHKFRTMWVPSSDVIQVSEAGFEYPVGTVLTKTFYYPRDESGRYQRREDQGESDAVELASNRLLETRLLVRRVTGWKASTYVWNDAQTEAFLRVAGASIPVDLEGPQGLQAFSYFVPNENQCAGCHVRRHPDGGLEPLGAVAHQLNHTMPGSESNLLDQLQGRRWLHDSPALEPIPDWHDESLPIPDRAVAYLDINCGHCHNPDGPADTSALLLDGFTRTPREMGLCKPPVAAGGGAGSRLFGIVPGQPDESILLYRMQSTEPDEMMPELGRSLVHTEALELISDWIAAMEGGCN